MNSSHPAVHPLAVSQTDVVIAPRVRMKDYQGMPGTLGGLSLRLGQFCFSVAAFSIMLSIDDFSTVTAFCYFVAATVLQCLWSLSLAVIDGYALLVKRSLRNSLVISLFVVGDGVTGTLTFAAACASAGITVLIGNDLRQCDHNHCAKYETATAMAFLSWFMVTPSFLLTYWLLATR
ncbi:hypothetical protein SUGI_1129950 [Cryptomeria japonica]|uniref:CASP-like protein 5A1 n=1 Tax=Cryptomeria japonica TaxID=3369 RepID=UPI002414792E|nr:CASP-like protein 5A1 [Cryptomeria japonica]XP_057819636.1 CASP-like protein 5A1 [Cryptomeria japonica]XP_057819637.1 CASP-like protein 5A1 [Cryptomeria japonica]XP_057819638.1 CASP-like protein 5A1 [Cryptomeria japonica]GLJ53044.1 hypothetical protein SUGI_1129950 [Cryptomeria japonica]